MAGLRLRKDTKYKMLVADTKPKKQVNRKGKGPQWIHQVHLVDHQGGNYYCEAWFPGEQQNVFLVGEYACFYLEFDGPTLDEIVALDCAEDVEVPPPSTESILAKFATTENQFFPAPGSTPTSSLLELIMMGQIDTSALAMLIAKDIFVAQIIAGKLEGNGPDLSYLFANATKIERQLEDMKAPI